jgi:hypothetical protein
VSTARAIEAVTGTLRDALLDVAPTVTARPLDRARNNNGNNQLNLFLYEVVANAALRNLEPPQLGRGGPGLHPPLSLDLRYLLTAFGNTEDEEPAHQLLGEAMLVCHDHALLSKTRLEGVLAEAGVHLQPERVRLTPLHLSLEDITKLWTSFQSNYRLSVAYEASVVLIDPSTPPISPLPVLRRGRKPRDAAGRDEGVRALAGAGPRLDRLSVEAWRGESSIPARTGDRLLIEGARLGGDGVEAAFAHRLLPQPIVVAVDPASTSERVYVQVPGALPAGVATVAIRIPHDDQHVTSNVLPVAVATTIGQITVVAPGGVPPKVRVACDRLAADQVVVLLAGELQFDALNKIAAGVTPEFELTGLPAGPQRLVARIRVDGVDSIPLASPQPGQPLPADFDQAQEISLP